MSNSKLSKAIVHEILHVGLADSTWRDNFPDAYAGLLEYAPDLEGSANSVLKAQEKLTKP